MAGSLIVPAIQLVGLSSAAFLSAWIASFSFTSLQAIQIAPTDLAAKQWSRIFELGARTAPPFAVACSASFAFLAYQSRNIEGRFSIQPAYLYGAAAAIAPCIVPYTRIVMWSGVQALLSRASGEVSGPGDKEVAKLIETWAQQNLTRSFILATAWFLGAVATFGY